MMAQKLLKEVPTGATIKKNITKTPPTDTPPSRLSSSEAQAIKARYERKKPGGNVPDPSRPGSSS